MKLIKRIKITAKYAVKIFFVTKVDEYNSLGDFCPQTRDIQIKESSPIEEKAETLAHELVHAIDDAYNIKLNDVQTEKLALGMLSVWKLNPKLRALMFDVTKYLKIERLRWD